MKRNWIQNLNMKISLSFSVFCFQLQGSGLSHSLGIPFSYDSYLAFQLGVPNQTSDGVNPFGPSCWCSSHSLTAPALGTDGGVHAPGLEQGWNIYDLRFSITARFNL